VAKRKGGSWDIGQEFQASLFADPRFDASPSFNPFPQFFHSRDGFQRVLKNADPEWGLGYDLEFDNDRPTVIGIANRTEAASVKWSPELARMVVDSGLKLIGHSIHGAEKHITQKALGITLPVERFHDSMLIHYLCNADLTKAPDKRQEEGEGGTGAGGFMNLYAAASLYTDLPQWKVCRGFSCQGPCRVHDFLGYNSADSYASPLIFHAARKDMVAKGIPEREYEHMMQLAEVLELMQQQGVKVDKKRATALDAELAEIKESLYPAETREFNPRSPKQLIEYFGGLGVSLEDTDKKNIEKCFVKACEKAGVEPKTLKDLFDDLDTPEYLEAVKKFPKPVQELHKLYCYKSQGKSTEPWFAEKYLDKLGFVHSRYNPNGACTGRLSSAGPNFQNIPARNWGAKVREAIIPRDSSLKLGKADYSQLELRICLYLAGVDPNSIGKDAFEWLLKEADGRFDEAATRVGMSGRDIAKSVSHGGDYMEGIKVLYGRDFSNPRVVRDIKAGALAVYDPKHGGPFLWEFMGGTVAFTGANLAERLFGSKSAENRKKALEIQEGIYFKRFQEIRRWQKSVTDYIESHGAVRNPAGRYLELNGSPEDMAKHGVATLGQGTGARYANGITERYFRERNSVPLLLVHDERVDERPVDETAEQTLEHYRLMSEEIPELPGFRCPTKCKVGPNWGEMQGI
jgi:hypothetical protein